MKLVILALCALLLLTLTAALWFGGPRAFDAVLLAAGWAGLLGYATRRFWFDQADRAADGAVRRLPSALDGLAPR